MKVTFPQRLTGAVSKAQPLCTVSPPFCYHRKNPTFGNSVRLLGVCAEINLYIFTHFRRLSNWLEKLTLKSESSLNSDRCYLYVSPASLVVNLAIGRRKYSVWIECAVIFRRLSLVRKCVQTILQKYFWACMALITVRFLPKWGLVTNALHPVDRKTTVSVVFPHMSALAKSQLVLGMGFNVS